MELLKLIKRSVEDLRKGKENSWYVQGLVDAAYAVGILTDSEQELLFKQIREPSLTVIWQAE